MTDWNAMSDADFRREMRQFFEAEYPEELRHLPHRPRFAEIEHWHRKLHANGWVAPAWPTEYGGMGLSASKLLIFYEEQQRWGVNRGRDMGVQMVGPLIIKFGTEAQKAYWLPRILSCKDIWCQGYSEPGAGSDLANLRTSAVINGDEFVINGQKTAVSTTTARRRRPDSRSRGCSPTSRTFPARACRSVRSHAPAAARHPHRVRKQVLRRVVLGAPGPQVRRAVRRQQLRDAVPRHGPLRPRREPGALARGVARE